MSKQTKSGSSGAADSKVDMYGPLQKVPRLEPFGDLVPYGDPNWYQSFNSPYYKDTHVKFRARVRDFVEKELLPFAHEWDEKGDMPRDVVRKYYEAGLLPMCVGQPWPAQYVDMAAPEGYDMFHELILIDELSRCASGGMLAALSGGLSIGLPPVIKFGPPHLKDKVARECLRAEKTICLAISEPQAASDVAGLTTTARREGDYYIVNGEKKWITNGVFADYFTVAVRTGGPGAGGLSLLLLDRSMPGITTRKMKCMGTWDAGTTYITFEDVKVPVANLIGKENEGFRIIMHNFNGERWGLCVQAIRLARICLEEAFRYALKRKTFGKRLMDHQVIRWKISEMARQVDSTQAWLENVTYQLNTMDRNEANAVLGGPIALLKVQCSKTYEYCAREAAQIFGGASYVRGGVGEKVERLYREVRAYAIPGGSEEIMLDLAAREAAKMAIKRAKL